MTTSQTERDENYELYRKLRLVIDDLPERQKPAACTAMICVALAEIFDPPVAQSLHKLADRIQAGRSNP